MGIVHVHRGRLAPALILMVLVALLAFCALLVTENANAKLTFKPTCAGCHTAATVHASGNANHTGVGCPSCHVNGSGAAGVAPSGCANCHGGTTAILAKPTHATNACGTTPGCHGVPPVVVTTTMALKVSPTIVRVGKSVKVTGTAGPAASLAGAKVALKVERKVGTKWVKMKTASRTASVTGAFTWSYKTARRALTA